MTEELQESDDANLCQSQKDNNTMILHSVVYTYACIYKPKRFYVSTLIKPYTPVLVASVISIH